MSRPDGHSTLAKCIARRDLLRVGSLGAVGVFSETRIRDSLNRPHEVAQAGPIHELFG